MLTLPPKQTKHKKKKNKVKRLAEAETGAHQPGAAQGMQGELR
jgi:hypothetical protein